jgi:hypothetical protein
LVKICRLIIDVYIQFDVHSSNVDILTVGNLDLAITADRKRLFCGMKHFVRNVLITSPPRPSQYTCAVMFVNSSKKLT